MPNAYTPGLTLSWRKYCSGGMWNSIPLTRISNVGKLEMLVTGTPTKTVLFFTPARKVGAMNETFELSVVFDHELLPLRVELRREENEVPVGLQDAHEVLFLVQEGLVVHAEIEEVVCVSQLVLALFGVEDRTRLGSSTSTATTWKRRSFEPMARTPFRSPKHMVKTLEAHVIESWMEL